MNQPDENAMSGEANNSARKEYAQPQLRTYGDLRMLTEGGSVSTAETAPPTPTMPMLMMLL